MTTMFMKKAQPAVSLLVAGGLAICPLSATSSTTRNGEWENVLGQFATAPGYALNQMPAVSVADEVRRIQDELRNRGRLTRQQIARAVGVDRRSLSAWASGKSVPLPGRMHTLRFLVQLVAEVDAAHPGQAASVLDSGVAERSDALTAIAQGRFNDAKRLAVESGRTDSLSVDQRTQTRKPLYAAAVKAAQNGELSAPTAGRTVRSPETYEMNLDEAAAYPSERTGEPRRKDYE